MIIANALTDTGLVIVSRHGDWNLVNNPFRRIGVAIGVYQDESTPFSK
jgi:hypothetical protein